MRLILPVLLAFAAPALAQMPQTGTSATGPARDAPGAFTPAPVPAVPPPTPQGGAAGTVPEQIAPGSGATSGPANSTPFSGQPIPTLPPSAGTGQDAATPKLSR